MFDFKNIAPLEKDDEGFAFRKGSNFCISLPAGEYFISDPCLIFQGKNGDWMKFVEESQDKDDFLFKVDHENNDGHSFYVASFTTAYGDGIYTDSNGNDYGVDAGLISIMNTDAVSLSENEEDAKLSDEKIIKVESNLLIVKDQEHYKLSIIPDLEQEKIITIDIS